MRRWEMTMASAEAVRKEQAPIVPPRKNGSRLRPGRVISR